MPATTVVAVAATASAGPFPERTAPTTPFTGEFGRVACCRVERLRGFAVLRDEAVVREVPEPLRLRLVVLFRLAVRPPDEDRLVRDCGFLLAIRSPSFRVRRLRTRTRTGCTETPANACCKNAAARRSVPVLTR
jgi:hypothetical protein